MASPRRRWRKARISRRYWCGIRAARGGWDPVGLEEEGNGVDAKPRHTERQPESHDPGDLLADVVVGDVDVGLVLVEPVQVVLAGFLIERPGPVLLAGEHLFQIQALGRLVDPHVPVAVPRIAATPRRLEPWVLVGCVVDDEVDDHLDATVRGGADHLDELAEGSEPLVDAVEVGYVVAIVPVRRRKVRHQPEDAHAEAGEVVDALGQPGEVAHTVAVPVEERLDVEAIDDRALPPLVARRPDAHRTATPR